MTGAAISCCPVCGAREFGLEEVLWPELVGEWGLSEEEVAYVNRQQGLVCTGCGNNLRSMALAGAVLASYGRRDTLEEAMAAPPLAAFRILELNGAGGLTPVLARGARHRCLHYPDIDLMRLNLPDAEYDLLLHSDTLEHVVDPVTALRECRRVLRPGGLCIFTVPVIVGRLSRSRNGEAPSYHGDRETRSPDLLVRTEFGADVWAYVLRAGFASCTLHAVEFPAGLALAARR